MRAAVVSAALSGTPSSAPATSIYIITPFSFVLSIIVCCFWVKADVGFQELVNHVLIARPCSP